MQHAAHTSALDRVQFQFSRVNRLKNKNREAKKHNGGKCASASMQIKVEM